MRRCLISLSVLTLVVLAFAGFADAPTRHLTPHKAMTAKVSIVNSAGSFAFKPAKITVKVGTSITWTNMTGVAHTVTSSGGKLAFNKQVNSGKKVTIKFTKTGLFITLRFPQLHARSGSSPQIARTRAPAGRQAPPLAQSFYLRRWLPV